jgi:Spy/CpxP family protein refolding chaperone
MSSFWRNVLITVVLAFAAAFAGARLGAQNTPSNKPAPLLSTSVYEMVHHELKLTPSQQSAIAEIDARYEHQRNLHRADISAANGELAQALASEMALGTAAQLALSHIQASLAQMQRESVLYALDVRAVLTPDQQTALDRKIFETLTLGPL